MMNEELALDIVRNVFRSNDERLKDAFNDFIVQVLIMQPNFAVTAESIQRKYSEDIDRAIDAAVASVLYRENT
jgi:hypothetical protein